MEGGSVASRPVALPACSRQPRLLFADWFLWWLLIRWFVVIGRKKNPTVLVYFFSEMSAGGRRVGFSQRGRNPQFLLGHVKGSTAAAATAARK